MVLGHVFRTQYHPNHLISSMSAHFWKIAIDLNGTRKINENVAMSGERRR